MKIKFENRHAKKLITDIKYSHDGKLLAMASSDGKLYLQNANSYELLKTIDVISSGGKLNAIDFSEDSSYIRIAANNDELFYFSVESSEVFQSPHAVKELEWNTYNVAFNYYAKGKSSNFSVSLHNVSSQRGVELWQGCLHH